MCYNLTLDKRQCCSTAENATSGHSVVLVFLGMYMYVCRLPACQLKQGIPLWLTTTTMSQLRNLCTGIPRICNLIF